MTGANTSETQPTQGNEPTPQWGATLAIAHTRGDCHHPSGEITRDEDWGHLPPFGREIPNRRPEDS